MSDPIQNTSLDDLRRRCPRLGSEVNFGYCRCCEKEGGVCFKALDCWFETFDVVSFFRQRLSPEAFDRLSQAPPPNKIASLVDLIRQAQERMQKEG